MNRRQLTIAIDYEGAYLKDRDFFDDLIRHMLAQDHIVLIVGNCYTDTNLPRDEIAKIPGPIVFLCSGLTGKLKAPVRKGFDVDFWILDKPLIPPASVVTPPMNLVAPKGPKA